MIEYDIDFIGQLCIDETIQDDGGRSRVYGGAALYGAMAAACFGKRIALELKLAPCDRRAVKILEDRGIDVFCIDADQTTAVEVSHVAGDVDTRKIVTAQKSGVFSFGDLQGVRARNVHLAGCNDHDFPLDFIRAVRKISPALSIDMQCLVRRNDPTRGEMIFVDDPNKREIVSLMDKVKLDVMEAGVLCGTEDLSEASQIVRSWGCPEVMITRSDGVMVRSGDETYFEKFTHRSTEGRTGRGDTTFGTYLAARVDYAPAEALKYAAALVSLKMETPGPFTGTLGDVRNRIRQAYS
jgi:sugar/nucleoside kinase (ribokinase family)